MITLRARGTFQVRVRESKEKEGEKHYNERWERKERTVYAVLAIDASSVR